MEHATSLLYDLEGFRVAGVTVNPLGIRVLLLECVQVQGCPDCGTVTERVHSHRMTEVRDLPFGRPWLVRWDKRRMFCDQVRCPRRTFVERSTQLGPRQRLTARLRSQLERAVSGSRRAASDVAREYGCRGGVSTTPWSWLRLGSVDRHRKGCDCSGSTRPGPGRCAGCCPAPAGNAPTRG